ncbi:MAG: ACP S-malonyltransferase [Rhodocyclaceae bacterium]|nr:ACP S-malonyltransferase [Rhodocyclaceae bacterium]MCA3031627.1 ACP S-malonyltransferase [Rhodocyclaceae bacterium]MCA3038274.1 ACP S-malonyltransferase [Rhodocyclaceae bacterium]MCA3047004.1 ACP S-malonyltransferase [Rhodocyclaceae bacterium]MCA3049035.1 ACP S-malonyltransferase [Rhodocyclaceae bacterium]
MTTFAITFAGQGSQSIGMMTGLATLPVVKSTFDEASTLLGLDLWQLAEAGPVELQNQTVNTQPLMLVAGVATWRAWQSLGGPQPNRFAGHSLGEYTALVAAGAMAFADAVPLVRFRAEAMQAAVPEGKGGIAAVLGLDVDVVRQVCSDAAAGEVLEAVNLNSPGQIVIAGHRSAVERGMALAKERGAKRAIMLPMSAPSHCALMRPAAEQLRSRLQHVQIMTPSVPVIQNADVAAFLTAEEIKSALVEQLFRPVRWIETVQALARNGATTVIECVPGKVLTGLNKRIESNLNCLAISDEAGLNAAIAVANA